MKFIWVCPQCSLTNSSSTEECANCPYKPDLSEARCIHGFAYDMACDECPRSGFRFDGVNMPDDMGPVNQVAQEILDEMSLEGPGFRCERLKGKIMTEEEWKKIHDEHKGFLRQEYRKEYNETQPPSYRLYHLICPGCGASLQCMEELEGVD